MNCMTGKTAERYSKSATDRTVRLATRYFSAATAEIMLRRFRWSEDRVFSLLAEFFEQFHSINDHYIAVSEYADILYEDYNFTVCFETMPKHEITHVHEKELLAASLCIKWLAEVFAVTLLDKFGWNVNTLGKFMVEYQKYIPGFMDGARDLSMILDGLRNKYNFDLNVFIR